MLSSVCGVGGVEELLLERCGVFKFSSMGNSYPLSSIAEFKGLQSITVG